MRHRLDTFAAHGAARLLTFTWIALVCACGGSRAGLPEDTLRIGSTLQPEEEWVEGPVRDMLFLPLLQKGVDGNPVGVLAGRYEHSADAREWVFHLRRDVRWHDGVPVTATDVKFTLDLYQHPAVSWSTGMDVAAHGDSTVIVRSEKPLFPAAWAAWPLNAILPAHRLSGLNPEQMGSWPFWTSPIGSGAYRVVRVVPKLYTELVASSDYSGAPPRIRRVIVRPVGNLRLANLLAGEVDLIAMVSPREAAKVAEDDRFRSYVSLFDQFRVAIYWNTDRAPLNDARVRRALTLAIDRVELTRLVGLSSDVAPTDGFYTPQQMRRGELPSELPYDPAAARRLLDEAGWRDRDGAGVRERNGRPFRITLMGSTAWFGTSQAAVYIQHELEAVGIQVDITMTETSVQRARLKERDFDAVIEVFNADGRQVATPVYGYRLGAAFDSLYQTATLTADPTAKERLYRAMSEVFREQMPATLLYPLAAMHLAHRRVRGLASPWRTEYGRLLPELWIEE